MTKYYMSDVDNENTNEVEDIAEMREENTYAEEEINSQDHIQWKQKMGCQFLHVGR